jgi:GDP-L-fucose synthase
MLQGKKVLVAGGGGFVGANLILRLLKEGARVRATTHVHAPRIAAPEVEWMAADLRNPEDCARACAGMEMVVMAAANTQGAAVIRTNPMSHVTPNVPMNTYMLDAAYQARVERFLFISSGAAYPDTGERAVTEPEMFDGPPHPVYHAVAWMKRYAEILCETYATRIREPMPCVVVRPSNIYGPYDKYDFATSHVTAAQLRRVAERHRPIEVWGTGADVRDLIYVDDFIEGLVRALSVGMPYLAVNICSGLGVSVREILETALAVDGYADAEVRYDPSKPSTIPVRRMDNALAKEVLGFAAETSLEEGFRRTLAWMRATPGVIAV